MGRTIVDPPAHSPRKDGQYAGGWWHEDLEQGRIVCDLCPRECHLKPGDRGFCFVRQNVDNEMVLTTYGRSTGFCIDPIEKKPLNHFYPGTSVLSFGTAGCNLGCKFCQNWDISKSREVERLSQLATPDAIVRAARENHCRSVAFTYNDPIVWAEYALDTARACREAGIATVAVTAGYISPVARAAFFEPMDAANVDLKGFTEDFYYKITYSHLQPVLETIEWLVRETDVWVELTNLVIPRTNDAPDELRQMCDWIVKHCGTDVPVHFSAFHPDFRMLDLPPTPRETLIEAYEIGRAAGIRHVYVGNIDDVRRQSTYCPHCGELLIERNWYALGAYRLKGDRCGACGGGIAGRFADRPGDWGRRRQPLDMTRYATPTLVTSISPPSSLMTDSKQPATPSSQQPASQQPAIQPALSSPLVDREQEAKILRAAQAIVATEIIGRPGPADWLALGEAAGVSVMGAFVTLKREGRLRACCGALGVPMRLADALRQAAVRTATDDQRFPAISPTELPFLTVDVNLLYGFQPVRARGRERLNAIVVGRHGLQIRRGNQAGLLLPSVPVEQAWDAETYLRQLCRKAGLPTTAWESDDVELVSFESREFGGEMDRRLLTELAPKVVASARSVEDQAGAESDEQWTKRLARTRMKNADLEALERHARTNLLALLEGGTPNYYLFGVADGTVAGLLLTLEIPGQDEPLRFSQFSLRPGVPLQATLFQLCESAAKTLRAAGNSAALSRLLNDSVLRLAVIDDPAMQGTVADSDLRGVAVSERGLMVVEQGRAALVFDRDATPADLMAKLRQLLNVLDPSFAGVYSVAVQTTARRVEFSTAARPIVTEEVRRPAVAGTFYPADPQELERMVGELLQASPRAPEAWPAAMLPHAGLIYSGKLAAAVFNRLEIPETVIVLGPKHTAEGVEWAVSPHAAWEIPGAKLSNDPALARRLVAAIPGLKLDAAAHRREHSIEVELPLLARLAPRTRVVGIVVGGGGWERCREFAAGLAQVLREVTPRPLLLISSDMNHFANDRENRRLDEIALQALEKRDPEYLLRTIRGHNISMCGVLPAVITLETLRLLGGLVDTQRVGYATSAEVSGDTTRVVGYAGMLVR